MPFWEKFALTAVQIALGFASCNFSVAVIFFPKSHSHPCDYLYILLSIPAQLKQIINVGLVDEFKH